MNNGSWYALQVRPRHERLVHELLHEKDVETFLPLYERRRRWSDRLKRLDCPLFPGYVFGKFHLREKHKVVTTSGVVRIIGVGLEPLPVADEEIAALQQVVLQGVRAEPHEFLSVGDRICLRYGPLAGLEGILIRKSGNCRLIVSVNLLRRAVAVEVACDWIAASPRTTNPLTTVASLRKDQAVLFGRP